jgi:hypothetical protein
MQACEVTQREYDALQYVLRVLKASHEMQKQFSDNRDAIAWTQGVVIDYDVMWNEVQRQAAPHVILVMIRESKDVTKHPAYALCTQSGVSIPLSDVPNVTVSQPTPEGGDGPFAVIEAQLLRLDEPKRREAIRLLRAIKRLVRT